MIHAYVHKRFMTEDPFINIFILQTKKHLFHICLNHKTDRHGSPIMLPLTLAMHRFVLEAYATVTLLNVMTKCHLA